MFSDKVIQDPVDNNREDRVEGCDNPEPPGNDKAAAGSFGQIDDAAYLSQPNRLYAAARLELLRGVRGECAGDSSGAVAAYRRYLAFPAWRRGFGFETIPLRFCAWRIAEIGGGR